MDSVTFAWTLAATLLAGVQLFVQRIVAHEKRDAAFSGFMMYSVSGVAAFAIVIWTGNIPENWLPLALLALAAGTVHSIGNYIRIEGLKHIHSVIFFPINKVLGPVAVIGGGIMWFGDSLSAHQYIGIILSLSVPLLLVSSVEHTRQNNLRRGLVFVVISTLLTSISMLVTKEALVLAPAVLYILAMSQVTAVIASGAIMAKRRTLSHITRRDIWLGFLLGVLGLGSYFTLLTALTTGLISIVYTIHAHYILIPIVLSVWWYKEHINARKLAAIVVSSLAIVLLYSA